MHSKYKAHGIKNTYMYMIKKVFSSWTNLSFLELWEGRN